MAREREEEKEGEGQYDKRGAARGGPAQGKRAFC